MTVLVTGATGSQGGAVVRALLARDRSVRALVRNPGSPAATALRQLGATLASADLDDAPALEAAITGAQAVFSVQPAPFADPDSERKQAAVLTEAARQADVRHFIHSSVSNAGDFRTMTGWAEGRWARNYWESKADAEAMATAAGFAQVTLLRPAFLMENFALPKGSAMFPDLVRGEILTAVEPNTRIALVAAHDIGAAVAAAIDKPERFSNQPVELAGDWLTLPAIADILTRVMQRPVTARTEDADTLVARGQSHGWVETQQWLNIVGYPARPEMMEAIGVAATSFESWAASAAATLPLACR
jgi:uncharacterized protein YbjT (DUF2867 family)